MWSEAIRALVPADSRWIRVAHRERAGGDSKLVVERRGDGNPVRLLPHRSRLRNGLQTHGLPRGRRALTVAGVIHVLAGTHLRVTGTIRPTAKLFQNDSPRRTLQ